MDKSADSNNYKMVKTLSSELKLLETQALLVKAAQNMTRPIRIYRVQTVANRYELHFEVNLNDIKRIQIFQAGNPDVSVFDSGVQDIGLNYYSYVLTLESEDVIPTDKYFIEVEDYNENKLAKGFPHNTSQIGDIYDLDNALDVIGNKLGVERRIYKTDIPENDYPNTLPPYCIDVLEWDACYEKRLKDYVVEYQTLPLPSVELKKYWGVIPTISGRWRALCYMDESNQDEKFMATPYEVEKIKVYNLLTDEQSRGCTTDFSDFTFYWAGTSTGALSNYAYDRTDVPDKDVCASVMQQVLKTNTGITYAYFGTDPIPKGDLKHLYGYGFLKGIISTKAANRTMYLRLRFINVVGETYTVISSAAATPVPINDEWVLFKVDGDVPDTCTHYQLLGNFNGAPEVGDKYKMAKLMVSDKEIVDWCKGGDYVIKEQTNWNEWDYPVYDVSANLDSIPKNINQPDDATIQQILSKTFPLSKKAYWQLLVYLTNDTQINTFADEVFFNLQTESGSIGIEDAVNYTVSDTKTQEAFIADYLQLGLVGLLDDLAFSGMIDFTEFYQSLFHDTDTDFALDTLTNCSVSGTGTAAYVKLDAVSGNQTKTSTAEAESSGGSDPDTWNYGGDTPLSRVRTNGASDASSVRADCRGNQTTGNLILSGFGFNIPTSATIVGIQMAIVRRQSGTLNRHDTQVNLRVNNSNKGSNKATTSVWPQSYSWGYYGNSTDTWGTSWTPAEINSSTFGVQIAAGDFSGSNSSLYIDYIRLQVWYLTASGELKTVSTSKAATHEGWDKVQTSQSVPSQCGSNALLYDVLKASDESVLLSNQTAPIDLSGIPNVDIKVKAKMQTADTNYSPTIDWIKIIGKKPY